MKFQKLQYSCAAASLSNVLRIYGKKYSEKTIRKLANTTKQGTSEEDMVKAITTLGFSVSAVEKTSYKECWNWLIDHLSQGHGVILSVNSWIHYVACIGFLGGSNPKVIVFDSDKQLKKVRAENGVFVLNQKQLKRIWFNRKEGLCHGLAIIP